MILQGQAEKLCEFGSYSFYLMYVISRLEHINAMLPGVKKWKRPLWAYTILIFAASLIREVFEDVSYVYGTAEVPGVITTSVVIFSLFSFLVINYSINFLIAKTVIKNTLELNAKHESAKSCRRLLTFVRYSFTTILTGSILVMINWDWRDEPLYIAMNSIAAITVASHFYFEWLFQVLLTKILSSSNYLSSVSSNGSKASSRA